MTNFEWKNRKRSFYLKFTDKIIWLMYQISWNRVVQSSREIVGIWQKEWLEGGRRFSVQLSNVNYPILN